MDEQVARILAAALDNIAASNALQAETNALLADKMDGLTRTIQGAQAKVDTHMKPLIERSKANAAKLLNELREARGGDTPTQ
jgi:hypothetical protein